MNLNLGSTFGDGQRLTHVAPWAVIALAALVTLMVLVRGGEHLLAAASLPDDPAAAADAGDDGTADADARIKPVHDRNLFAPVRRNEFGGQLVGVLGDRALFNGGQSARVGESAHGAKLIEIGADWARVEFDGDERRLEVFDGSRRSAGRPSGGGSRRPTARGERPSRRGGGGPGRAAAPSGPRGGGPGGFSIPPEAIERFRNMPAEQRARLLERMPANIRQQIEEAD
ncbi:MAG: hypothetical protein WD009_13615 [Phycisphaeraceae bacterium]